MLDHDDQDDAHLCIKCSSTIIGLQNYIEHRKMNCKKFNQTDIAPETHNFESFPFTVPPPKDTFNYELHQSAGQTSGGKESRTDFKEANKNLSDPYDYNYGLGADIFFSSLELQSSSKSKSIPSTSAAKPPQKIRTRKTTAAIIANQEHEDVWINSHAVGSDKLLKAVSDISGTKKVDTLFGLIRFPQDSPEPYDEPYDDHGDEDDEDHHHHHQHQTPHHHGDDEEYVEHEEYDEEYDDDYHQPPRSHTGGKWKPEQSRERMKQTALNWVERDSWEISEVTEVFPNVLSYPPPPSHTQGKWVPGTKIGKLDFKPDPRPKQLFNEQKYWCNTCNRKLASRIVYERHLKSSLHMKRSQPETELDEASRFIHQSNESRNMLRRPIKPSMYLDDKIYSARKSDRMASATVTSAECGDNIRAGKRLKRRRRKYFTKCEICKTRLPNFLIGKHLISHYHYRRMFRSNQSRSYDLILQNIDKIAQQSPFQCHPCRFYANTEPLFMRHWNSKEHADQSEYLAGRYWCSFCKFECEDTNQMRRHLYGEDHQEVVRAINRSVPIVIRKRTILACEKCKEQFYLNIELRMHSRTCSAGTILTGTASNSYQSKHKCFDCYIMFKSRKTLQKHQLKFHQKKIFFCSLCELNFGTASEAKKHRTTTEHKIVSAKSHMRCNLVRKCPHCSMHLANILKLKEHMESEHPNKKYSCSYCGDKFTLSQELSRHVREKKCTNISLIVNQIKEEPTTASLPYQTIPILPTYTIIVPTNTVTTSTSSLSADGLVTTTTELLFTLPSTKTIISGDTTAANLSNNIVYDKKTKNWYCKLCNFKTTFEAEHIFHETLHKNTFKDDKMACPICGRKFKKHSLRYHLRQHTNEREHKCNLCNLAFTRKSNLRNHVKNICGGVLESDHPLPTKTINKFICNLCTKEFKNKYILEQHFHCHRNQVVTKSFPCAVENCLFSGRCAAELRNHLLSHSDEKTFFCGFVGCNYKGKSMVQLKRHSKVHEIVKIKKIHKCPHCNFTSKISGHLKRHIRIHTGEKPYKCPHCDYSCNNSENLRKHVLATKIHPGRSLYECKYCDECGTKFESNILKDYKVHLVNFHNIVDN